MVLAAVEAGIQLTLRIMSINGAKQMTPDNKRINPELIKKAAEMARPGGFAVGGSWSPNKQGEVWDAARKTRFDIMLNLSDAWLLEEQLNIAGWVISYVRSPSYEKWFAKKEFNGWDDEKKKLIEPQSDDDRRLILYKCVSAQKGIDMYVGGE